MTVFTFSIALILVISIVHVVIALQKDHIKRTGGDSIVDVIGAVALAGTTPIAHPRQTILTSLLFLNCVLLSCYLPRFFKYKENSALLQESTVFSLGVTVVFLSAFSLFPVVSRISVQLKLESGNRSEL